MFDTTTQSWVWGLVGWFSWRRNIGRVIRVCFVVSWGVFGSDYNKKVRKSEAALLL